MQVGVTEKETALTRGQRRSHSVSAPRFSAIKLNQTSWHPVTSATQFHCPKVYRGMTCEQLVSSLFTKHADVFPVLYVVASAAAVLHVTNASPEQGIFNPEQDFDKAAEPTFGRNPRTADENLYRRPAKQPDGLSQGFAAVAI